MGKSQKAPPPPDYSGVANASAESARLSYQLGQEQLAWAREQYNRDSAVTDRVVNAALEAQAANQASAERDRARYEAVYQPLEDQFIERTQDYFDPAKIEARAAGAATDVSQQFELARRNAQAQLEGYGVDPSQVRAGALDLGTRTQEAAARAGAANNMRLQMEGTGNAMLGNAINTGKGYPAQVAVQYGTGLQGGNQAANTTLGQTASGAATMGTGAQWQGLGNSALGVWGNTLSQGYNSQMQQYNANANRSSGLGSLLGLGLGMGTKMLTGGLFEEGGMVEEEPVLPEAGALPAGRYVEPTMSPSRGAIPDDIPAVTDSGNEARINAGEFIVPEDTVRWFGEKHFQGLIEKGRKEEGQRTAKPSMGVLPVGSDRSAPALPV